MAVVRSLGNALWDLHIECAEMKVEVKVKVKRGWEVGEGKGEEGE